VTGVIDLNAPFGGPLHVLGAALMEALTTGDSQSAAHLARRLGVAGVVAVVGNEPPVEVVETVGGWKLVISGGEPDAGDLAAAAALRAVRLRGLRRGGAR
jgi:dihydrodipicolinate synthase/N-acetylneuraminate lyase